MVCSRCNNVVPDGAQFCNYCGNNLTTNINNQVVQNNMSNNSGMTKKQKTIIISLLMVVVILLGIVAINILREDKIVTLNDGSRTIMIYMVGSNLETESKIATSEIEEIDPDSIDLDKTNVLLYTGGTEKWHNFIKNDENAIYQLKEDGFEKIETYDKTNMGDYTTLLDFLNYSTDNYNTQYYDLILYNHGGAIQGAIYDDFTNDNLSLEEFKKAMDESVFSEKNKLNTVLFRTCLNGTIEVATVFAPYAKYLIASEEITNGQTGESVLNFINNVSGKDDAVSYGKKFIKAYEDQMENIDPLGFSTVPMYAIVDLSKIDKVNDLLEKFISGIDLKENYKDIVRIRSDMYQYGYTSFNEEAFDTVDLYTLVSKLSKYSKNDSDELLEAIEDAIVYNWSEEKSSNGLSIYFPYNGAASYQKMFLSVYKNLDNKNSYYKFIGQFNSFSTSKEVTSFAHSDISKNETVVDGKEFSLQLTEEQASDYANSIYIIFRKDENGLYAPIYSSDNTEITDNGLLKTNISNNLIKLYDKSDKDDKGSYLMIVERGSESKKTLRTTAVLKYFDSSVPIAEWRTDGATVYFDTQDENPKISNYMKIDGDSGASGIVLNPEDYNYAYFSSSRYKILDEKGNYTPEWDNEGNITVYEIKMDNIDLKMATLDKNEEYFCVFKIQDIYGNIYYSKLLNIK